MIVLDVWGGEGSMNHVARYITPIDSVMEIAKSELEDGYLINMRKDLAWGDAESFDTRKVS